MNDIDKELIRSRLKERRLFLGMTYQDLSFKTGISKSSLQRYETGTIKNLSYDKIFKLSEALEVSTTYFTDLSTDYTGEKEYEINSKSNYRNDHLTNLKSFETKALRNLTPTLITNGYSVEQHDRGKLGDLVAKKGSEIWHIDFLYTEDTSEDSSITNTGKQQLIFRLGRLAIYDKPITKYSIVMGNYIMAEQLLKFKPTYLNIEISLIILNEYGFEELYF